MVKVISIKNGMYDFIINEFKCNDIQSCLRELNIISPHEELFDFKDILPWKRGGAETYIGTFSIKTNIKQTEIICKAIISTSTPLDKKISDWNIRRTILLTNGISTPKLFSSKKGVIYETYISDKFILSNDLDVTIIIQLAKIAYKLDLLGFNSINFIEDLRIDNNIVYYIDFGFDLGSPTYMSNSNALNYLKNKLNSTQYNIVLFNYN